MAQANHLSIDFAQTDIHVGTRVAYRITANGIEPAAGFGGMQTPRGQTLGPRLCHTGGMPARVSTDGTERAGSTTTMQLCEIFVPANMTLTGISLMNGASAAGNIKVAIIDSTGTMVPGATNASGGAGVAQSGNDAYQRFAFNAPAVLVGPATYFVATVSSATSPINTHAFGDFGAGEVAAVYATAFETTQLSGIVVPTTFTAGRGPIASFYA